MGLTDQSDQSDQSDRADTQVCPYRSLCIINY